MKHLLLVLPLLALALGCSSSDQGDASTPQGVAAAPVAAADFCARYSELHCTANVACCSSDTERYASVEECLAASPCPTALATMLSSPRLARGELVYDASAAGEWLHAYRTTSESCATSVEGRPMVASLSTVLQGTLVEGASCASSAEDPGGELACAPGLACRPGADGAPVCVPSAEDAAPTLAADGAACEDASGCASGRCDESTATCQPRVAVGAACVYDEDCASLRCTSGACARPGDALYCGVKPAPVAPSNGAPTKLSVKSRDASGAGTSSSVYLEYRSASGLRYGCTIPAGSLSKNGSTASCTPSYLGKKEEEYVYHFFINLVSNTDDGFRVDRVCADSNCQDTFFDVSEIDSEGCTIDYSCNSFWLDSDDHGKCSKADVTVAVANTTAHCND